MRDQKGFAKLTRTILRDLELGDDASDDAEAEGTDEAGGEPEGQEGSEGAEATPESETSEAELSEQQSEEGDERAAEIRTETAEATDAQESDEGIRPRRPEQPFAHQDEWGYRVFTAKFDEIVSATDLCDGDELSRLRNFLDQQLQAMQGVVARLANRLQRLLLAQQNRSWEFDLEEGLLDTARLPRIIIDPMHPLSFKRENGDQFPRHGGHIVAGQFRFDARAADHGGGDVRRYSRAHA